MPKLGFAVIGTGNISSVHIDAINKIETARLTAIMSHDKNRAEEFAKKYNAKSYSDIDELLKDNDVNVVDIVSYHDIHVGYALKAVMAGKHVVIEKPIDVKLDNIDELINEAKKNNVKITVISQHRYDGALIEAKRIVDSGELGNVLFVNLDIISNRAESYYTSSKWRASKERAGGGVLIMNAIHLIDVILWMFGEAKSAYGKIETRKHDTEVEDNASALIRFKNKTNASIHVTSAADYNHIFRMSIYGDKKTIMVDGNSLAEIKEPGNSLVSRAINKMPVKIQANKKYSLGSIAEQLKDFVKNINENKESINAVDGKKALEVVLAIYKSNKTGKEVNI